MPYGLELIEHYVVKVVKLSADSQGLPHKRSRVWIILILKSLVGAHDDDAARVFQRITDNLEMLDGAVPASHLSDFLVRDAPELPCKKRAASQATMQPGSVQASDEVRKEFKLPRRVAEGGQPFSSVAPSACLADLSAREREVMDVALLMTLKQHSELPMWTAVDVSQSVGRSWCKHGGRIGTLTTSSHIVVIPEDKVEKAFVLNSVELFQLQGWPVGALSLPPIMSRHDAAVLAGNMMAVPAIGAVLHAVLAAVELGEGLDLRSAVS